MTKAKTWVDLEQLLIVSARSKTAGMRITIMPVVGSRACTRQRAANSQLDKPAQRFCSFQTARGETTPNDHKSGPSRLASSIEISSLVRAYGITRDRARRLVNRFGNNRARVSEAARILKARVAVPWEKALQSSSDRLKSSRVAAELKRSHWPSLSLPHPHCHRGGDKRIFGEE
jgi:hypothetical protein